MGSPSRGFLSLNFLNYINWIILKTLRSRFVMDLYRHVNSTKFSYPGLLVWLVRTMGQTGSDDVIVLVTKSAGIKKHVNIVGKFYLNSN